MFRVPVNRSSFSEHTTVSRKLLRSSVMEGEFNVTIKEVKLRDKHL